MTWTIGMLARMASERPGDMFAAIVAVAVTSAALAVVGAVVRAVY